MLSDLSPLPEMFRLAHTFQKHWYLEFRPLRAFNATLLMESRPPYPEEPRSSFSSNPPPAENTEQEDCVQLLDSLFEEIENYVAGEVEGALKENAEGTWPYDDDSIFHSFGLYAEFCWHRLIPQRASALWVTRLSQSTIAAERRRSERGIQPARIHKGSPYFNVGLSMFMAGDFDHAMVLIAEAGEEDQRSGRADASQVLIGNNALSERILINPIANWICKPDTWGDRYQSVTARTFDKAELQRVLTWASARLTDALQLIVSLHRMAGTHVIADNAARRHLRIQALSDSVITVESTLRRWQTAMPGQQLHGRLLAMLRGCTGMERSFTQLHDDFSAHFPAADRETAAALNWTIDEALQRIEDARTTSARAGLACYLTYKLRNNLLHVMDDAGAPKIPGNA
jgi:hypothetical protein